MFQKKRKQRFGTRHQRGQQRHVRHRMPNIQNPAVTARSLRQVAKRCHSMSTYHRAAGRLLPSRRTVKCSRERSHRPSLPPFLRAARRLYEASIRASVLGPRLKPERHTEATGYACAAISFVNSEPGPPVSPGDGPAKSTRLRTDPRTDNGHLRRADVAIAVSAPFWVCRARLCQRGAWDGARRGVRDGARRAFFRYTFACPVCRSSPLVGG